jgi:UDP-N-acetylmuramoyl-L-alanyl-D-glutamate--2,6-diaminopimelate ligase
MKLSELLSVFTEYKLGNRPEVEVSMLTTHNHEAVLNSVFFAVRGTRHDGHQFVNELTKRNEIAAVVLEDESVVHKEFTGAIVRVKSVRDSIAPVASRFYGEPSKKLFSIGVTGTNGKTSTTYMIEHVLNAFGMPTGVMGTINHHFQKVVWESNLTTPDPISLQKRLHEFVALGAKAVAFEVSSHALDQGRVTGIPFDVVVFTNLTRDHLDYHGDIESYFKAKAKLFNECLDVPSDKQPIAVINSHDSWGNQLEISARAKRWTYGENKSDFQFQVRELNWSGCQFQLTTPRGEQLVKMNMTGVHNIYNATAAIAVGLAAGASLEIVVDAIGTFAGVPGRLQRVPTEKDLNVYVDYAHTDDALKTALNLMNQVRKKTNASGKIITVFGCGGDRDRGKRPLMAAVAVEMSDVVIVTTDNPRTENPVTIVTDILAGIPVIKMNEQVFVELDRREAIRKAIELAGPQDVVIIAGKGHENYHLVGAKKFSFDDVLISQSLISN